MNSCVNRKLEVGEYGGKIFHVSMNSYSTGGNGEHASFHLKNISEQSESEKDQLIQLKQFKSFLGSLEENFYTVEANKESEKVKERPQDK